MNRLMGSSIAFAAALAALTVQPAVSSISIPLKPSGPWTVEYADSMCIVGRKFRTGDQQVTLGFRPGPLSEYMRIALWFADEGKKFSRGMAMLALDGLAPVEEQYAEGPISIKGTHLVQIDTERPKIETLHTAKLLHVRAGDRTWTFSLGNIAGAMKALAGCEKDLLVKWGMDPVVLESIETQAVHPNGIVSIFRTDDYPSAAIMGNEQGTAGVHFRIGTNGRAGDCRVVESSGSKNLDAKTCMIITKRARYQPAKTKAGQPVESIGFQRIRWEMP